MANFPNLRYLLVLRGVRRYGTASAAARAVHRSQPAVTQAIQQMENHFGMRLFERGPHGMVPTGMGEAVLGRVERALEQLAQGLCEAQGREPAGEPEQLRLLTGHQLHALMALDEHRSFAAAALALRRPRPNVHRAARDLERALGVPLFERTSF